MLKYVRYDIVLQYRHSVHLCRVFPYSDKLYDIDKLEFLIDIFFETSNWLTWFNC